MMNEPSIEKLTAGGLNRYQICIATAKVAREIIDEYNIEDRLTPGDEKGKKPVHDDKPVKTAVHAIDAGEYEVNPYPSEDEGEGDDASVLVENYEGGEDAPLNE